MKKFIPIIGTVSSGKSTFLKGLLGLNVLETGLTTTTKFVSLIKNGAQMKFYHVIPKKEKYLEFIKDGEEIFGEENIKNKIIEINKSFSEKPGTRNDIFYILETPIKNIENDYLLKECYFMDIPGLNENENSYIEEIFSLITLDDIKFEIIVFNSRYKDSDNLLNIIQKLEEKKCLKKSGNLFILNKIDQVNKNGENEIINNFKQYFYQNFEDDKKENLIMININENNFIPMNSILYLAETRKKEDFCSMLIYEFFCFIELKNKINSFYEYIQKKFNLNLIDDNAKITDDEFNIIRRSVDELDNIKNKSNPDCYINIRLNKKIVKNNMIKLFLFHKTKYNYDDHSKYYIELKQIITDIDKKGVKLISPPLHNKKKYIPINKNSSKNKIDNETLKEFENFFYDTFKKIDPDNELENFKSSLENIRKYIFNRKMRIAFIGNVGVGKSTILNSIIGEDILPTDDKECTYRGVIIRHMEGESFKLYKSRFKEKGKGNNLYYYFEEDKNPYCTNIKDIKSYLTVKNNDKNIEDKDAYLVIKGHLKIFDFIKLDENIISKIEFIDLPGSDVESNTFNKNNYHNKILKFSNCCIFINVPENLDTFENINKMIEIFGTNKQKIFPNLRKNFIKTCLFLINKIDELDKNEERKKLKDNIIKNISNIEKEAKDKDINISFFSGTFFLKYLNTRLNYVFNFENNPELLISNLYKEYYPKNFSINYSFRKFIEDQISKIEEDFFLNEEEEEEKEEEDEKNEELLDKYKKIINTCIEKIENNSYILIRKNDNDTDDNNNDIVKKLYNLSKKLKNKDYSNTKYSSKFFDDLKSVIENSEKLYQENFNSIIKDFLKNADILFSKELKKDIENKTYKKKKEKSKLNSLINDIQENFIISVKNIKKIFSDGNKEIISIIDEEIQNKSEILKKLNFDLDNAVNIFKNKIEKIIEQIQINVNQEFKKLLKDIEQIIKLKLLENDNKLIDYDIDFIENNSIERDSFFGFSFASGFALAICSLFGIEVCAIIAIVVNFFFVRRDIKNSKIAAYEKGLKELKSKICMKLNEYEKKFFEDFQIYEDEIIIKLVQKLSLIEKDIVNIESEQWKEIQKNYDIQKDKIMKIIINNK